MSDTMTREQAVAVLQGATREVRDAARVLIAGGNAAGYREGYYRNPDTSSDAYARLALPEPKITRPRVEVFGPLAWRIDDGVKECRWVFDPTQPWEPTDTGPCLSTHDDARRWLELWERPEEEVPADA